MLPKEFPLKENEELPVIRRRIRTEFTFSDKLLMQPKTKEEEKLTKLELEFEIHCKVVKATSKLCNEMNTKKSIKKQRKQVYQQALAKLKDIEKNLQLTKKLIEEETSMKRKNSMHLDPDRTNANRTVNYNPNEELSEDEENLRAKQHPFDLFSKDSALLTMSAPSTPVKSRLRHNTFMAINEHQLTDHNAFINPRIENLIKQRHSNNNSPEYDTISSATSSIGSTNNVLLNNYYRVNNYEELIENSPETEAKKLFGAPTRRRTAIAPNLSQDDCNLLNHRRPPSGLLSSIDKYTNERLRSLTRHNSLDKVRQQETLKENVELDTNRISSTNLLSPNLTNLQSNQFNFGLFKHPNNKSQNNINMAQRPLPSPPTEHKKQLTTRPQQLNLNKEKTYPAPLNLNNPSEHGSLKSSFQAGPSLIKNPIKSPSAASMFLQSPLDFEKAASIYLQQRNNELHSDSQNNVQNRLESTNISDSTTTGIKPVRSSVVRTPVALTINTCSSDLQIPINQSQQLSPVPLLPPRTPITSKPNLLNALNPNSINSISNLNLNSYQASNFAKNMMISSNPNLNYITSHKPTKGWVETCIDTFVMPTTPNNYSNNFVQNANFYHLNSMNLLNDNQEMNKLNAINKYAQLREKENQFINASRPPPPPQLANNYTVNQSNHNQLVKENSQSSLSSNSMLASSNSSSILSSNTSNLHTSQVFQPFFEEIKPYELSDFYKVRLIMN